MGILANYKAYKDYEPQYEDWNARRNIDDSKREIINKKNANIDSVALDLAQKKARVIADSVLLLDNYGQTKAEDVETVFQTVQMELLGGLSAVIALPFAITGVIPFLEKHSGKSPLIEKFTKGLNNYNKASINVGKFKVSAKALCTAVATVASSFVYVPMVTNAVTSQLGATRRAKFEGMNNEFSSIKDFAILTDEQEKEVQQIKNNAKKPVVKTNKFLNKFKEIGSGVFERVNISKSISSVDKLMKDKKTYLLNKQKYDSSLSESEKYFSYPLSSEEINAAKEDQQLFENIIKKVDLESQDPLERVEKVVNVGYSSLFVGSFLQYLTTDGLLKVLRVKQPILQKVLKFGVPLVTYMVLNKNLANLQNSAIKAVRYKKINEFVNNKDNFNFVGQEQLDSIPDDSVPKVEPKKENIFKFLKGIFKDIKEYKAYKDLALQENKEYMKAKEQIKLSSKQEKDAKQLQKNTFMAVNKVEDNNQKYSESVETLSEIALAPLDILSTYVGSKLGKQISVRVKTVKYQKLFEAAGALLLFIPTALTEIYTTSMQRRSLRISSMLATKEIDNYKQFVDYDDKSFKQQVDFSYAFSAKKPSQPFIAFQKKFNKD